MRSPAKDMTEVPPSFPVEGVFIPKVCVEVAKDFVGRVKIGKEKLSRVDKLLINPQEEVLKWYYRLGLAQQRVEALDILIGEKEREIRMARFMLHPDPAACQARLSSQLESLDQKKASALRLRRVAAISFLALSSMVYDARKRFSGRPNDRASRNADRESMSEWQVKFDIKAKKLTNEHIKFS